MSASLPPRPHRGATGSRPEALFRPQHARVIEVLLGEDVVDEVQRRLELLRHVPLAREEQFRPLIPHTDLDAEVVRFTLESRERPVKDQLSDIGLQDHRFGSLGRESFHLWVGQRVKHFPNGDVGFLPEIGKEGCCCKVGAVGTRYSCQRNRS